MCLCFYVLHLFVKGASDTQPKSPGTQESPLGRGAGGERVQESSCRRRRESFGARKAEFEQERGCQGPGGDKSPAEGTGDSKQEGHEEGRQGPE